MTYSKEVYHWRKEHGICTRCGKHEATYGTRCVVCASEQAEKKRQEYKSMTEEEKRKFLDKRNERRKKLRQKRKGNGLCRMCGKPVYKNYTACYEHYLYMKRKNKEYAERRRKGFAEEGKCRICGKEVVKGKKLCQEHLEQARERMKYASQFKTKAEAKLKEMGGGSDETD